MSFFRYNQAFSVRLKEKLSERRLAMDTKLINHISARYYNFLNFHLHKRGKFDFHKSFHEQENDFIHKENFNNLLKVLMLFKNYH